MAKKSRKDTGKTSRQKAPQQQKPAETAKEQTTPPVNAMEVLKERMKQANKGGLLDVLNQVKNTKPEEWKDAEKVKDLARKLATQFKLPVSEERLDQFMKAYKDATKGGEPQAPEQILKKYGQGRIDPNSLNEFNKFIK